MDILKDENIKVVCKLHKSSTPITSKIVMDDFTDIATKNFDYDFDGTNKFYPYEMNDIVKNLDFNIMCIVGASGSGKSTFSKYYGGGMKRILSTITQRL